ncbi:hypothetical protein CSUI_011174, partial [Cystoisospora suis]
KGCRGLLVSDFRENTVVLLRGAGRCLFENRQIRDRLCRFPSVSHPLSLKAVLESGRVSKQSPSKHVRHRLP